MQKPRLRRLGTRPVVAVFACLGLLAAATPVTLAALSAPETHTDAAALSARQEGMPHDGPVLDLSEAFEQIDDAPHGVAGDQAIAMLGGANGADLAAVASAHRMTPAYLAETLAADDSLHLDADGRLLYADSFDGLGEQAELDEHRDDAFPQAYVTSGSTPLVGTGKTEFPLSQTFKLHSRPGSPRTIYLDLDGHTFTATNGWHPAGATFCGWFGNVGQAAFTADQRREVQDLWRRVASHYEAFDVDVTTEDPGEEALRWDGTDADVHFGHRAVVSSDPSLIPEYKGSTCGGPRPSATAGLGYIDAFKTRDRGESLNLTQDNGAQMAYLVNHEVGHVVGLNHTFDVGLHVDDKGRTMSYDVGAVTTFSQEERRHASIHFWRPGPAGTSTDSWQFLPSVRNTRAEAEPLRVGDALEATLNLPDQPGPAARLSNTYPLTAPAGDAPLPAAAPDEDWYSVGECSSIVATARPVSQYSHLNLKLSLRDASGAEIALDAPTTSTSAELSGQVSADGDLYLVVSGSSLAEGGVEPVDLRYASQWPASYSSGTYALDLRTCGTNAAAPLAVQADTAPDGTITVAWQAPGVFGGGEPGPLDGYEIALDGRRAVRVGTEARSHVFPATPEGASVRLRTRSASGPSVWTEPVVVGTAPIAPVAVSAISWGGSVIVSVTHDPRWLAQEGAWGPTSQPQVRVHFRLGNGTSQFRNLEATTARVVFDGQYTPAVGSSATVEIVRPGYPSASTPYTVLRAPTSNATVPPPSNLRLRSTASSTRLSWTPPVVTPDWLVGYEVSAGGEVLQADGDGTSVEIPARLLTVGEQVTLTVSIRGGATASASLTVPAGTRAGVPTGVEVREDAAGSVLRWDAYTQASVTGALTGWRVTVGGRVVDVAPSATRLNLTGFRTERTTEVTLAPVTTNGVGDSRTVKLAPAA